MAKVVPVKPWFRANLFWTAQNAGFPVTLVNLDAEEPNVAEFISGDVLNTDTVTQHIPVINTELCVFCGKCFNYCNYNAIIFLPANHFLRWSKILPRLRCMYSSLSFGACRKRETAWNG